MRSSSRRTDGLSTLNAAVALAEAARSTRGVRRARRMPALLSVFAIGLLAIATASCSGGNNPKPIPLSDWMAALYPPGSEQAGTKLLSDLAIPGSHDSGTFSLDVRMPDEQQGSNCTSWNTLFSLDPSLIFAFAVAQTEDLVTQLDGGIRYLDLRIAFTGEAETGWRIVHTFFSAWDLAYTLQTVVDWADEHPNEIVILDFQHICYDNSPSPAEADTFVTDLNTPSPNSGKSVCDLAFRLPARPGAALAASTIEEIRAEGRNLIVLFAKDEIQPEQKAALDENACAFYATDTPSEPQDVEMVHAWPSNVGPTWSGSLCNDAPDFGAANEALLDYPLQLDPPLGSLKGGKGLYQSQLIYSLTSSTPILDLVCTVLQAGSLIHWESNLANPTTGIPLTRTEVVEAWGAATNIVVSDNVQGYDARDRYITSVIEQNAADK